jgi:hypothetical protein
VGASELPEHVPLDVVGGSHASRRWEGFGGGRRGKEDFWCPWRARVGQIYRQPSLARNHFGRVGAAGGKHCPTHVQILAATVARTKILRQAPCLRRRDVHAGEVGNKCIGPLDFPPTHPGMPHFAVHDLTHTDRFRLFQTQNGLAHWRCPNDARSEGRSCHNTSASDSIPTFRYVMVSTVRSMKLALLSEDRCTFFLTINTIYIYRSKEYMVEIHKLSPAITK